MKDKTLETKLKQNDGLTKNVTKELSEKKSERTTFNLHQKAIDDLSWLADRYNITIKEAIDICLDVYNDKDKDLNLASIIIKSIKESEHPKKSGGIRKTLVISMGAQRLLKDLSKKHDISRDVFLDMAIRFLRAITEKGEEEDKKRVQQADNEVISIVSTQLYEAEEKLKKILGKDHEIVQAFGTVLATHDNLTYAISDYLTNGKPIDPWSF